MFTDNSDGLGSAKGDMQKFGSRNSIIEKGECERSLVGRVSLTNFIAQRVEVTIPGWNRLGMAYDDAICAPDLSNLALNYLSMYVGMISNI